MKKHPVGEVSLDIMLSRREQLLKSTMFFFPTRRDANEMMARSK